MGRFVRDDGVTFAATGALAARLERNPRFSVAPAAPARPATVPAPTTQPVDPGQPPAGDTPPDGTIPAVIDWVRGSPLGTEPADGWPERAEAALAAEVARGADARSTLVDRLRDILGQPPAGDTPGS
jgi:hypothetical protein